jgi:hypothetical protein
MSKFLPDPQIQSLRAMRAGDIAFAQASPVAMTIGTQATASPQPVITKSITVGPVVPALEALSGTPSESPVVGVASATVTTQNANQSISVVAVESLETLAGTPSESPVVGVATGTLVV